VSIRLRVRGQAALFLARAKESCHVEESERASCAAGIPGSDFQKQAEAQTPLGRMGRPQDVAPAVVFLASPDSGFITGETLYISGGLR
jgi:NAD(P)-dependent dehydrogenase (short-subunit alcohol dehydrogenase family)